MTVSSLRKCIPGAVQRTTYTVLAIAPITQGKADGTDCSLYDSGLGIGISISGDGFSAGESDEGEVSGVLAGDVGTMWRRALVQQNHHFRASPMK